MPRLRHLPAVLAVAAAPLAPLAAIGAPAGAQQRPVVVASGSTPDATVPATNPFIPDREDVTECVGLLERPDCGSEARGGYQLALVLIALMAGLAFIGWRIVASARRRPPPPPASDG